MFQIIPGPNGYPVLATRAEIVAARLLINPITRAVYGIGSDTGAPLPGVLPEVEAYVRRHRWAA